MSRALLRSTAVVSLMTTLSRLLGLVRDVVIARYFGAGAGVDAFIVAFRIPNFLRRLFAEGGFSQAFVPVLGEYKTNRSHEDVQALIGQTCATLGTLLAVVTVLGILSAPLLVWVFAPGFAGEPGKQMLAADMLRITFPYILFISLTAMAGGVLNTYRRFAVPAFTPVLLNLSLITCAVLLAPRVAEPVTALAWGVLIAGVVQLAFQIPYLARLRLLPRPGFNRDRSGVRRIVQLMIPTLFAASITQINLLVDTLIASFLQNGSIAWLYYSDRLVEFPLGVFGIALATVIMPSLAAQYARESQKDYRQTLDWALRWVLLISVPAAVGLALLAAPLLTTLFQYQEFTGRDVRMAARSLLAYALGLPAFVTIKILSSAFFARQDTATPVKAGVIAMLANVVLNLLLVGPLAHAGLALATSLAALLNAGLLYWHLQRRDIFTPHPGWLRHGLRVGFAVMTMSILLWFAVPAADAWDDWVAAERIGRLLAWVVAGMFCYATGLWLTGLRVADMTARSRRL